MGMVRTQGTLTNGQGALMERLFWLRVPLLVAFVFDVALILWNARRSE